MKAFFIFPFGNVHTPYRVVATLLKHCWSVVAMLLEHLCQGRRFAFESKGHILPPMFWKGKILYL